MNCWNRVVQTMAASGKPVLYADFQFAGSGGFLVYTAGFLRPARATSASSPPRFEDMVAAVPASRRRRRPVPDFDFAAATAKVRVARTPKPGDLAVRADALSRSRRLRPSGG